MFVARAGGAPLFDVHESAGKHSKPVTPTKQFANIPTDELDVDDPAQFIIVKSRFKAILDTTAKAFLVPSRVVCSWFHETSGICCASGPTNADAQCR